MKIQGTTSQASPSKKKASASSTSGHFQTLLQAQIKPKQNIGTEQPDEERPQQQQPAQQPVISHALNTLEEAMLKLDEGEAMSEQALQAIADLRLALRDSPSQASEEAETLLAVEAKRLETLNKF